MASTSPPSISLLSRLCKNRLMEILEENPMLSIERSTENDDTQRFLGAVEDCRGRFSVWAANLGAFQPPISSKSLDSRLRDAPRMRSSVTGALERIGGLLARAQILLQHAIGLDEHDELAEKLEATLSGIRSAINHLFALSILIRRERPKGRLPGSNLVSTHPDDSPHDIVGILDKFPKVRDAPWLAQSLGNAISQRRRNIQYRQDHRRHLAEIGQQALDREDAGSTKATTFREVDDPSSANGEPDLSQNRVSVCTFATSFMSSASQSTDIGGRIADLDDMVLDGVRLRYQEPFECPYCRTIQTVGNVLEWRNHVFSDLQPYICTFERCPSASLLYSARHEWMAHEMSQHRRKWACVLCAPAGSAVDSQVAMTTHLRDLHPNAVTETQLPVLLEACEQDQKHFAPSSCPLCESWQSDPPAGEPYPDNARLFYRHLGHHQQLLALEAMPLYIEGLEVDTQDGDERGTGSEDPESERSSESEPESSAAPISDDQEVHPANDDPLSSSDEETSGHGFRVLFLAASLYEFNINGIRMERGYPYLKYQAGEIFDVVHVGMIGREECWLAKNQDDSKNVVGWVWAKHFARLADS
ncbi:hypothetical protein B0T14DRAFT_531959 [Immersiella caudata]|uniref:Oxidoreductase acuF-like C2H2 type zinc-finger domain-containing protein n=1 Tax=Immersiella caudata TaxID=314043 RepID=A0AA39WBA9_9PEZI|nr:hypothetical protein B0T14DRAFT_531959 [Immersiella caudata]